MTTLIKASAIVLTVELAAVLLGVDLAGQTAATKDEYQRSADIYGMRTSARSGPQRGEEIYGSTFGVRRSTFVRVRL